jgi:processing peptidase subunit alpha
VLCCAVLCLARATESPSHTVQSTSSLALPFLRSLRLWINPISRLANLVFATYSMETYGQVSTVGTVSNVGSQWEGRHQSHVTHLLEAMAFGTTQHRSGLQVAQSLQDWGGSNFANSGREQSLHCIDVLRPNVDQAVGLLAETLLEPAFDPRELQEAHMALEYQAMNVPPELWLAEALQMAAYGPTQPLGQAHFLPSHKSAAHLTPAVVRAFWEAHFVQNPHEIVVAGAGIAHAALVELADRHFGHLQQQQASPRPLPPSQYQGGQANMVHPVEDGFIRIGLVWPSGGWFGDDLVATCVLQTLLGGGNSFSAGGPGKGMYSRLYRQVLNRYAWAESAEALTAFYNDSGLWGVTGSTIPRKAADLVKVLAEHVARIAVTPVTDEELFRARNMLKNNVLTQLESRLVLFEDLGRQVLTYGKREDMWTTCQRIDAVTAEDLMRVARQSLTHPPSLAAVGDNLDDVPRQEEVARWFN